MNLISNQLEICFFFNRIGPGCILIPCFIVDVWDQRDLIHFQALIIIIVFYSYSRTGRLESIFMFSEINASLKFFRASFEGLCSLRLCLIISTLIYSHSDSRVPTHTGSTHFIDPLEDERLRWTDLFRPVIQKQLENISPLCGTFCLHD